MPSTHLAKKKKKKIPFKHVFPSPPWSLFSPFPPLFKSTLLTSLQYHLSHTLFDLAEAPSPQLLHLPRTIS